MYIPSSSILLKGSNIGNRPIISMSRSEGIIPQRNDDNAAIDDNIPIHISSLGGRHGREECQDEDDDQKRLGGNIHR